MSTTTLRVEVWSKIKPNDNEEWQQYFKGDWYLTIDHTDSTLDEAKQKAKQIAQQVNGWTNVW